MSDEGGRSSGFRIRVTTPLVFLLVLSLAVAKPHPLLTSDHVCNVRDFGALGDNSTIDSSAIEKALHACSQYPFSVVFFAGPATYRINQSVVLRDHLTLLLDKNTTIFYDNKHYLDHHNTSTLQQTAACGIMGFMGGKNTPVICGKDLNNTAVVGTDATSVIDGGGWNWWGNHTDYGKGPQTIGIMSSRNITIESVTVQNSPNWHIHPVNSKDILLSNVRILAPRFTANTDGFDPDSCENVVVRDTFIDTGDDGISIKSGFAPSRNIHIYNTTILSRNFCVGSGVLGGVHDVLVEDCRIGDDFGSSPWAIKYKAHQYKKGNMTNHTFRNIRIGKIAPNTWQQGDGGAAFILALSYGGKAPDPIPACPPNCPNLQDVTFENIVVTGAVVAGGFGGTVRNPFHNIKFKNISFLTPPNKTWICKNIDHLTVENVSPPLTCINSTAADAEA